MHVAWRSLRRLAAVSPDVASSTAAAEAIVRAAEASGPGGLTVIALGPPTNVAAALELSPAIVHRLKRVVLMGGELTGTKLDLNFMSDRGAARAVIASPVPTVVVPIQTCAQVSITAEFVEQLERRCCPGAAVCALARKMALQTQVMPWLVNKHVEPKLGEGKHAWVGSKTLRTGFIPWDVVALMAAFQHPLFSDWETLQVLLPPCAREPCNGTMEVEGMPTVDELHDGPGEAHRNVAIVPQVILSEEIFLGATKRLLCSVPATKGEPVPQPLLGFLFELG
eukprot:878999-Prymnesium_polylepis.1